MLYIFTQKSTFAKGPHKVHGNVKLHICKKNFNCTHSFLIMKFLYVTVKKIFLQEVYTKITSSQNKVQHIVTFWVLKIPCWNGCPCQPSGPDF